MADRFPNKGRPPRDKNAKLGIEWANGQESKWTYTADQLRWTLEGSPFDIAWFWKA